MFRNFQIANFATDLKQTNSKKAKSKFLQKNPIHLFGCQLWWFFFSLCGRILLHDLKPLRESNSFWNMVAIQVSTLSQWSTKVDVSNNLRFNPHRLDVSCKKIMCCGRTIFVCKEEMMLNEIARLGALAFRTSAGFLIL